MWKRLQQDRRGAIAILAAVVLTGVVMLVAVTIEYGMLLRDKEKLQSIADSAALAGASRVDETLAQRELLTQAIIDRSIVAERLGNVQSTVQATDDEMSVALTLDRPTMFRMLGASYPVVTRSVARLGQSPGRVLDIVLCIDATTSMAGTIMAVRQNASRFPTDLATEIESNGLGRYGLLRARAIYFRDIVFPADIFPDSGTVWAESPFYAFPGETSQFQSYVDNHTVGDSGRSRTSNSDVPESGYECLYKAMKSEWKKPGDVIPAASGTSAFTVREVTPLIVTWTDAAAKPLDDPASRASVQNPAGMPASDAAFRAVWSDAATIDQSQKTIILFGPCAADASPADQASWAVAMSLTGAICGGDLQTGNSQMVQAIAASLATRIKAASPRLTQ